MKLYSLYADTENHTLFSGAYPYGQNKGMPPPPHRRPESRAEIFFSQTLLNSYLALWLLTWIKYLHSRHVKTTVFIHLSFSEGRKVIVKEVVEPNDTKGTPPTSQLYRNPTFLGVLIGVCALIVIVIVCLLLVAFRAGHLNADKIQGTVLVQKPLVSFKKRRALSMCQNWPARPLPDQSV